MELMQRVYSENIQIYDAILLNPYNSFDINFLAKKLIIVV